jgi:hypothetical protein
VRDVTRRDRRVQTKFATLGGVTTDPSPHAVRRAARLLALVPAILVTGATGTAFADAPEQWQDNGSTSPLHVLLVLVVIPVALFLLITLLVYLPSMSRGETYHPGLAWRHEPEWFGGPRDGLDPAQQPTAVGAGRSQDEAGSESELGGASGRW